jgi:hypothetical protein
MTRFFRRLNRYVPKASIIFYIIGILAAAVYLIFVYSPVFADFINVHISSVFRALNAHLTGWIPFSLAEFLLISSPILLVCAVVLTTRRAMRGRRYFIRCVTGLLSVVVLIASMFVFTFGAGYRVPTIDRKLGIPREKVSAEELAATMEIVIDRLNALVPQVIYVEEVGSIRPYSHEDTVRLCLESYAKLSEEYPFIQKLDAPVKQIMLSEYMTYTHISGVYTFFTGEANLNTNYPYFVNVYTTAHEMAHQRGIARENEANFLAYLVCIHSDDPYMQYAGYLNMYEYLASPLYSASPSLYSKTTGNLNHYARYDLQCYSEFFEKYRDNTAADVSNAVNNTYLVLQGTEGSKSYGMVVDLAVAYHLNED